MKMNDWKPNNASSRTLLSALGIGVLTVAGVGCSDAQQAPGVDSTDSINAASDELAAGEKSGAHPIAVGHGKILYSDGTFREPTPDVLRESQSYFIQRLHSEATPDVKERLAREVPRANKSPALSGSKVSATLDSAQLEADAEVLDWLVETVAPRDRSVLHQLSLFIRNQARQGRKAATAANTSGVASISSAIVSTTAGAAYAAECAAAGVPNPPSWGSSSWVKRTSGGSSALTPNFLGGLAEVYTFTSTSPAGICIALPRRDSTSDPTIDLLGIICQGNNTSRSCFWDSSSQFGSGQIGVNEVVAIPSAKMIGGADLLTNGQGECTDCHAGENSFIIHPGSLLDVGASLTARNWVRPLIGAAWHQNVAPGKELQRLGGACATGGCHTKGDGRRFPRLEDLNSGSYCSIARTAVGTTMPASAAHESALTTLCANGSRATAARFQTTKALWHGFFSINAEVPRIGDFNGDGRDDIVTFASNGNAWVATSTGTAFSSSSVWRSSFAALTEQLDTGDFNGDGKDDIITARMNGTGQVFVALSSGTAFGTPTNFNGHVLAGEVYQVGDFNGDRKDDIAIFTKGTTNDVLVQLSNGSSFGGAVTWHGNFSPGSEVPLVGDFNADGYEDIVSFTGGSAMDAFVALSNGSSFGAASLWHGSFGTSGEIKRVADMNGDGRDDIVTFNSSNHRVWVAYSTGTSFSSSVVWHTNFTFAGEEPFVGDVDADHRADGVLFTKGSAADVLVALAIP